MISLSLRLVTVFTLGWCARIRRHSKTGAALLQIGSRRSTHPEQNRTEQYRSTHPAHLDISLLLQTRVVAEGESKKENPALLDYAEPLNLLSGWEKWQTDQKLKIVYGVSTSPLPKYVEQMSAVAATWAKDVGQQRLLVVGVEGSIPGVVYKQAPMCKEAHTHTSTGVSCKEATMITTAYALGADWVIVLGSDNYAVPQHFEERLANEDASKNQILGIWGCGGGHFCRDHLGGLCGGGGYAISRGAMDAMVGKEEGAAEKFIEESMRTARDESGFWCDQVTACIARRRGVQMVQLEGLYGWRLCEVSNGSVPAAADAGCGGMYATEDDLHAYTEKILSPSPKALTFHYIDPPMMHALHQIVKQLEFSKIAFTEMNQTVSTLDTSWKASAIEDYALQRAAYIEMVNRQFFAQPTESDAAETN